MGRKHAAVADIHLSQGEPYRYLFPLGKVGAVSGIIVKRHVPIGCRKCGNLVSCVCGLMRRHAPDCPFLVAAKFSIELACIHGYQACPICDPCSCKPHIVEVGIG